MLQVNKITVFLIIISAVILFIPFITIFLALITSLRSILRTKVKPEEPSRTFFQRKPRWSNYCTSLYSGRVSHTRFQPVLHSFSYPLFFCCLNLKEVDELFLSPNAMLWPLSLLMQFRTEDHLKNGEGLLERNKKANKSDLSEENASKYKKQNDTLDLSTRIRNLISERTNGKYKPSPHQTILLLTHLSYFGYCFNPVSFYYVMKADYSQAEATDDDAPTTNAGKNQIEAIVAEVSNTPWNEMQCYVLHKDSVDMIKVQPGRAKEVNKQNKKQMKLSPSSTTTSWQSTNYVFNKTFHVSPFMDMNHIYDWTFYSPTYNNRIIASTSIMKGNIKYFNAYFDISRTVFTPINLCYQLIRLPVYCLMIQIWIHVEAFRLFLKGVEFIPHPLGSSTVASNIIASVMAPFFAISDWWKVQNETEKKEKST